MNERKGWRIRWWWIPAAVFFVVVGWSRYGVLGSALLVATGLGVGLLLEWRARRRSRKP
jgi:hypothetical protein